MAEADSDAAVLFGATGDLTFKKIFPALHAMVQRGRPTVPVIGIAQAHFDLRSSTSPRGRTLTDQAPPPTGRPEARMGAREAARMADGSSCGRSA